MNLDKSMSMKENKNFKFIYKSIIYERRKL